jgi:hypothetical protein
MTKQFGCDPGTSPFRDDTDPLQLALAAIATRKMARGEADDRSLLDCDVTDSRWQGVLWIKGAVEIAGDAVYLVLVFAPFASSDASDGGDVDLYELSIEHGDQPRRLGPDQT